MLAFHQYRGPRAHVPAPGAAEQTNDIRQIKELDSIAKMMESTFDKPQNKGAFTASKCTGT